MPLIDDAFRRANLVLPIRVQFENLSRIMIALLMERFVNPDRILMSAKVLGISEELLAQIIVYTQMRDALRQIAPRYFRNPRHREEVTKAFIDTLEKLDKDYEEEQEKEEKNKKGKQDDRQV
jgi:type III secretion protein W